MNALPVEVAEKLDDVRALCEKHGVKRLTLFGSAVKGTFDRNSDLDFLVELLPVGDPVREGRAYMKIWTELERLFNRRVDLVDPASIENPYVAASIQQSQRDLYEAA
jgi:uncharacterized protein